MPPVTVIILHAEPAPGSGPLQQAVAAEREAAGRRLADSFRALGVDEVRTVGGPPDGRSFGRRLAALLPPRGGLVIGGSGSAPLATPSDLRPFASIAASDVPDVLANNRYSADLVAIPRAAELPPLPDLPADNALPRWLEEVAGRRVRDLRWRWRLQVDLDGPLDVLLVAASRPRGDLPTGAPTIGLPGGPALERLDGVRAVLRDRRAEAVVAGRTSSGSMRWLERHAAARIRAFVEERGLRAASRLALGPAPGPGGAPRAVAGTPQRPPRSILGLLLDRDGPAALGPLLAELGDGALVDTRVLLAHRLGPDEARWPDPEDRFASDLLLPDAISDLWLRDLTRSALEAPIPILLGGHSLVGPGVRLVLPASPDR